MQVDRDVEMYQMTSGIFNALSLLQILQSTLSRNNNLSRVELRSGGTVGETLSTGVDSLVTELLPTMSVLSGYDLCK